MNWRDSVASGIPEDPTPGPAELRGDIIDELNDHLACALQRELRRTEDASAAEQAVLNRFGDPRKVARQLWWDAVKEKVMRDRILLAAVAVVTLASLVVSVAALRAVRQGQEVNQALLATIQKIANTSPEPRILGDWAKLKVVAIEEGPERRPLKDVEITLTGKLLSEAERSAIRLKTDATGIAQFGPIRPGVHHLSVLLPDGCATSLDAPALYPSAEQHVEVICPHTPSEKGTARFVLNWPEGFDTRPYAFGIGISGGDRKIGDFSWAVAPSAKLRINPQSEILSTVARRRLGKDHEIIDISKLPHSSVTLPAGTYYIQEIAVYIITKLDNEELEIRQYLGMEHQLRFDINKNEETEIKLPELATRIKQQTEIIERSKRISEMQKQRSKELSEDAGKP